jgi:hypothetical protein
MKMQVNTDVLASVFENLSTWLVMLSTGVIIWAVRQVIPDAIEENQVWRVILRILPLVIGAGIALIPGLQPITGNLVQSAAVGLIGGSFATKFYELARELFGEKIRAILGSKAKRNASDSSSETTVEVEK